MKDIGFTIPAHVWSFCSASFFWIRRCFAASPSQIPEMFVKIPTKSKIYFVNFSCSMSYDISHREGRHQPTFDFRFAQFFESEKRIN